MSGKVSARVFQPGSVAVPLAGTIRWSDDGKPVGVWGDPDNPCVPVVIERDGSIRTTNRAERRMLRRLGYLDEVQP